MHLLIVEDDEMQARNLKRILEAKGFAADYVTDAGKARTRILLYRNDYALILLDLSLPGGSGLPAATGPAAQAGMEITKRVREEGVTTPIIIVTGTNDTKTKVELLNAGADDYIVKPFASDELVARINSVLRRPAIAQPPVRKLGALSVDTAARRIRVADAEIPLTLKEFSLFECLSRKPNQVVTRDELCTEVWDFDSLSWSNVLDVHMKNLRKKLSAGDWGARLETVRGVGYRLVV